MLYNNCKGQAAPHKGNPSEFVISSEPWKVSLFSVLHFWAKKFFKSRFSPHFSPRKYSPEPAGVWSLSWLWLEMPGVLQGLQTADKLTFQCGGHCRAILSHRAPNSPEEMRDLMFICCDPADPSEFPRRAGLTQEFSWLWAQEALW